MSSGFFSKYGAFLAGFAAIIGGILAFFLCIGVAGYSFYLKPGSSILAWMILSVSSVIYRLGIPRGQSSETYVNPLFKLSLDIAGVLVFTGFLLSVFKDTAFMLQIGFLSDAILFSAQFLDNMLIMFVAALFLGGIGSIKRALKKHRAEAFL